MSGYRKLSRTAAQRKALLRNQVTMLLYHGKIVTTEAKAKEVRRIAEGLIALGCRSSQSDSGIFIPYVDRRADHGEGNRQRYLNGTFDQYPFTCTE